LTKGGIARWAKAHSLVKENKKGPSANCKFAIEQFSRSKKIGKVQISDFPEKHPVLYHNPAIALVNL
jgi:hypothetical protein